MLFSATINVEDFGRNNFAWLYRGGNMNSMFNTGWSPWTNSMSYASAGGITGAEYSQMREDGKNLSSQAYGEKYGKTYKNNGYWLSTDNTFTTGDNHFSDFTVRGIRDRWIDNWVLVGSSKSQSKSNFSIDKWMHDHSYAEVEGKLSVGAQSTFIVTEAGVAPAPYIRGSPIGFNVNLGSLIFANKKITSDVNGIQSTKFGKTADQGIGVSLLGVSAEYSRTLMSNKSAENVVTGTIYSIGFRYNFTTSELIVGFLGNAGFSVGLGGSIEVVSGLRFK